MCRHFVDLRSDTVTRPTQAMLDAMYRAEVGDDGVDGDPTVRRLEEMAAERSGKEAGLFMPSGTMGNLVAALCHGSHGVGEAVMDEQAHMARSEVGGLSRLASLFCARLPGSGGEICREALEDTVRGEYAKYGPPTAFVLVETSHNHSGGRVPSLEYMRFVRSLTQRRGVPLHVDGARAFNAASALGVSLKDIAALSDSLTFCLSKGLSAPMGSVLTGTGAFIAKARVFRRMAGGGLRQAGYMAAAGIVALESMVERLAEDHARAKTLWRGLKALDSALVPDDEPQTNILVVQAGHTGRPLGADWTALLKNKGVLGGSFSRHTLRLVTHRHIDDAAIEKTVAVFKACLEEMA